MTNAIPFHDILQSTKIEKISGSVTYSEGHDKYNREVTEKALMLEYGFGAGEAASLAASVSGPHRERVRKILNRKR